MKGPPELTRFIIPPLERDPGDAFRHSIRLLAVVVIIPNAAFWIMELAWSLPRPVLNLDYALLALLFPWLGAMGAAVGVAVLAIIDLLVAGAYHFHGNPGALLVVAPDVLKLPLTSTVPIGLAFIGGASAIGWTVGRLTRSANRVLGPNLVATGCAVLLSLALGPLNPSVFQDKRAVAFGDLMGNTLIPAVGMATENRGFVERPVPAATTPLFAALNRNTPLPQYVVLVILESWGEMRDPALRPFSVTGLDTARLNRSYDIERGLVPMFGSTVKGEIRELCAAWGGSVRPDTAAFSVEVCLPYQFHTAGYRTIAIHGFRKDFFNRDEWWPGLGFDRIVFRDELAAALSVDRRCGTVFEGICDPDVVRFIEQLLDQHRREEPRDSLFIYWLSLSSHTPRRALPGDASIVHPCETDPGGMPDDVCLYLQWNEWVTRAVSDFAVQSGGRDVAWVIVGDHPPVFAGDESEQMLLQDSVPWLRLWPREGGEHSSEAGPQH